MRGVIAGVTIGAVAAIALVVLLASNQPVVHEVFGTSCTVGMAGADVTITLEGAGAEEGCATQVAGPDGGWYRLGAGEQPLGALTCRTTREGVTYTVRDTGMHLYGSSICANVAP